MSLDSIERSYTFHPLKEGQVERYQRLRAKAKELAYLIDELCPQSHERSIALTELDSSVMWANAAIDRH